MEIIRNKKIIMIIFFIIITIALGTISIATIASAQEPQDFSAPIKIITDIFGEKPIQSVDFLKGFDEETSYVFVRFKHNGYAVFLKDTMEMLEYSPDGKLPFVKDNETRYYAGPGQIFANYNDEYTNICTGEKLSISKNQAACYSKQIAKIFQTPKSSEKEHKFFSTSETVLGEEYNDLYEDYNNGSVIDEENLILADPPGAVGVRYVSHPEFFLIGPQYGYNRHGTCGSVATQLLLSYHNYYTDRRIIDSIYSNGYWTNAAGDYDIFNPANFNYPECDPNACSDPRDMTSLIIGSRSGEFVRIDDLSMDIYEMDLGGFYYQIISHIEPNALNCTCTQMKTVVDSTTGMATDFITTIYPDGSYSITSSERIALPGEMSITQPWEHTYSGSNITQVTNGLNSLLGEQLNSNEFTVDYHTGYLGIGQLNSSYVTNQINAGNPVIIGMRESLGGLNHWVLGYGYQSYTYPTGHPNAGETYSGYIVHFGWPDKNGIWINQAWCDRCITLELQHTHNYNITTDHIIDNAYVELRCGTCGHRTVDPLYEIENGCITGVRYPRIGSIILPATIDGTPLVGIGARAFMNQTQMTGITIPRYVTSIGNMAFKGCTNLANVSFTSAYLVHSLTTIGDEAFAGCGALTEILLPTNVAKVGFFAFPSTTALKPNSTVTRANVDLIVPEGTQSAYEANGWTGFNYVTIRITSAGAIKVMSGSLRGAIAIPPYLNGQAVTEIAAYGFANQTALTRVEFASVTTIGKQAFSGCSNLERAIYVSLTESPNAPDHTTSYTDSYYTERCLDVRLVAGWVYTLNFKYNNLHSSSSLSDVFTSLGVGETGFSFDLPVQQHYPGASFGRQHIVFTPTEEQLATSNKLWCRFIRTSTPQTVSVEISEVKMYVGVTSIDMDAFTGCGKLASPGLSYRLRPDNKYAVEGLDSDGAVMFYAISGTLFIPSAYNGIDVVSIDAQAFRGDEDMKWAFFQSGLQTIGSRAFQFCSNLRIANLSQTAVTRIEDYTFDSCALSDFSFPSGLTYIGEGAFIRTGSVGLLPSSVTTIGAYAFAYTGSGTVALPTSLTTIGNYAFAYSGAKTMDTGASLISIGAYAFYNTQLLGKTTISATVQTIGEGAFMNSGFANPFALSPNNALYSIGANAFNNCGLTKIVLSSTVTTVGTGAFGGNESLTIYTSYGSKPSGWHSSWNSSARPVVWGCVLSSDRSYVISFTKSATNPTNGNATNGISNPIRTGYNFDGWYVSSDFSGTKYTSMMAAPYGALYVKWVEQSCVAEGTLITLADGSHVAVEDLTGEESLLVWNLITGQFDSAPILFLDSDPYRSYEITHLYFSDGTEVKVIDEHAFWDVDLNRYVFLRNDAAQYIGHWFCKQSEDIGGNMTRTNVQLVDVEVYQEQTTAWSPVTYGHLCFYVNDMLSMPGATEGLINIFEVDPETMAYDAEAFAEDIAEYGLYTYEEFAALIPIPEEMFDAFNGQYLKVAIGKGLITLAEIALIAERYAAFFL